MTDKIKIKANKFVNDKKLKLNYIKTKDLKLLLAEFCEEQIAELKAECDLAIEGRDVKIAELETRCNELFLQTCEQAEKIKELKSEIENDRDLPAIAYMQGAEKQKKKDEEELQKWKDEWQEQVQKATDEGYARTLQTIQLSKAKEIIKTFLAIVNNDVEYVQNPQDCKDLWKELCENAEQFIKDSEVENDSKDKNDNC